LRQANATTAPACVASSGSPAAVRWKMRTFHHHIARLLRCAELKPQLRTLLHYHCGVKTLRTRQMMMDLQSL
jgi:hypothetical protein